MDIKRIREDLLNYQNKLFVNSAGAALIPKPILQSMQRLLNLEAEMGGYAFEEHTEQAVQAFYTESAGLLHTHPNQIAFTTSATDAFAIALSSIPFKAGDVIITSEDDYSSNQIQLLSLKERFGIRVKRLPLGPDGIIDLEKSEELIRDIKPTLVAITHVPTNSGKVQDVQAIGEICNQLDIWYLVDACQSVGQFPVDVNAIQCDFLSVTGRKFLRGPRGTGLLYVSQKALDSGLSPLFIDTHGAKWQAADSYKLTATAQRFEQWETAVINKIGFAQALSYLNEIGIEEIGARNEKLSSSLRDQLSTIKKVRLYDEGSHLCNIITLRKEGVSLEASAAFLKSKDVFFSVSTFEPGLLALGKKDVEGVIRLSPHYFNTEEEMSKLVKLIDEM